MNLKIVSGPKNYERLITGADVDMKEDLWRTCYGARLGVMIQILTKDFILRKYFKL